MSRADLDRFSEDTNGKRALRPLRFFLPFPPPGSDELTLACTAAMSDETFQEIQDFFDVIEEERLTFKGFLQLYQLQTGAFLFPPGRPQS